MEAAMLRLVLDTNVLVAGLRSRNGASFSLLRMVADRRIRPLATIGLFLEYEAVLKRPEQRAFHGLSDSLLEEFLAEFAALCEPVEVHFVWRPQLSDPSDEMVLEAMVNGRGDALVTHNIRDFLPAAKRFGIAVVQPATFVKGMAS